MPTHQKTNIEKEVKFKIASEFTQTQLENFLKQHGLILKEQVHQKDVYWDNFACEIINLKRGLRVRYVSSQIKDVEFKSLFQKENGQYVIEEVKLLKNGCLDTSALKEILLDRLEIGGLKVCDRDQLDSPKIYLSKLGLSPVVTLEKVRSVWVDHHDDIEVSVDVVADLGVFVEVEQTGNSEQVYDQTVEKFEKSSFAIRDITHSGYLDLILTKNSQITSKSEFEKKFAQNHKWNVKRGEENVFLSLTR